MPMPRRPGTDLVLVGPRLLQAVHADRRILLRRIEANVVLGFGGYVSTPAYLAARRLGLPIVIHEQNVLPGLANKLAARLTRHVYTSFPQTPLPHARLHRPAAAASDHRPGQSRAAAEARARLRVAPRAADPAGQRRVAGRLAASTALAGGLAGCLPAGSDAARARDREHHSATSCGSSTRRPGRCTSRWPTSQQMERAYAAADLMLARSGAGTVLETAAVGLPAVFVPYPHGNGEQARNAELVVSAGGGIMLADGNCTSDVGR